MVAGHRLDVAKSIEVPQKNSRVFPSIKAARRPSKGVLFPARPSSIVVPITGEISMATALVGDRRSHVAMKVPPAATPISTYVFGPPPPKWALIASIYGSNWLGYCHIPMPRPQCP